MPAPYSISAVIHTTHLLPPGSGMCAMETGVMWGCQKYVKNLAPQGDLTETM